MPSKEGGDDATHTHNKEADFSLSLTHTSCTTRNKNNNNLGMNTPMQMHQQAGLAMRRCCMAYFKGALFVVEQRSVVRRGDGVSQILRAFMFGVSIVIVASFSTSLQA